MLVEAGLEEKAHQMFESAGALFDLAETVREHG